MGGRWHLVRRASRADARIFERAFDESPVPMLLHDDTGTTLRVNRAHRQLTQALTGAMAARLYSDERTLACEVSHNGASEHMVEFSYAQRDGSALRMRLSSSVVNGSHHVITRLEPTGAASEPLADDLRSAVSNDELRLHYQPIIDLGDCRIAAMEALVRWQHPTLGLLAPDRFVGLAERTGLIAEVGQWVLESACREAVHWQQIVAAGSAPSVAVNVSATEIVDPGLPERVRETLERTGLPAGRLCLELTEGSMLADLEQAKLSLQVLRELGVNVAIDDFGVGYSSIDQVRQLRSVSLLKIDKAFVSDIAASGEDQAIVTAVNGLATGLGMDTVAEGIETEAHLSTLQSLGCTYGQGFLFARPLPASELPALLGAQPTGSVAPVRQRHFARALTA